MKRRLPLLAAGALLAAAAVPALAVTHDASNQGAGKQGALVKITDQVVPGIAHAHLLHPVAPSQSVQIGLVLNRPDPAGEAAFLQAVADPKSPEYRHFMTPAQFDARFGIPAAQVQRVQRWATSTGLTDTITDSSGDYLLLTGSAAAVEKLVHVKLGDYLIDGKTYYANNTGPTVPAALHLQGVLGLDSLHHAHTDDHVHAAPKTFNETQGQCTAGVCIGELSASDLRTAYDLPEEKGSNQGTGGSVAVFGEGAVDQVVKDLRQAETSQGEPRVNVREVLTGDDMKSNDGLDEWDLDTQASTGMALEADELVLYFGKDLSDASINASYAAWTSDKKGPLQANASFGECEPAPIVGDEIAQSPAGAAIGTQTSASFKAEEAALVKAQAEGRTLFASTGDQGSSCYYGVPNVGANDGLPLLSTPAASPHAVGVGGTVLFTDATTGKRSVERAWDGGGGGQSQFITASDAQIKYLKGTTTVPPIHACISDVDGNTANAAAQCRTLPDVSAESGDLTSQAGLNGYRTISDGAPVDVTGTSLSSPLTVGMWERLQAGAPTAKGLGFAADTLYKVGTTDTADDDDFFDVTVGTNGVYDALPRSAVDTSGYDLVSGLGVMDVRHLLDHVDDRYTARTNVRPPTIPDVFHSAACHNGAVTDPAGDATSLAGLTNLPGGTAVSDQALDLRTANISYVAKTASLLFTIKVTNLADPTFPGQYFRYYFSYGGSQYYAVASRDATGTEAYELDLEGTTGGSLLSDKPTGSFTDATSTVTVTVPLALFNSTSKAKPPLALGDHLTGISLLAQREAGTTGTTSATLTADTADAGGCDYVLGAAAASAPTKTAAPPTGTGPSQGSAPKGTGKAAAGSSTLASTGLGTGLPAAALVVLTALALLLRRRTS